MNPITCKNTVEAILMSASDPLAIDKLIQCFPEDEQPDKKMIQEVLQQLENDYQSRGIELKHVANGYRIQARKEFGPYVAKLWEEKPPRLSRAYLETLALIVYRQPITRAQIEDIRGVAVSSNIITSLQDRNWVKIVGHKEVPGRPALFATTKQFLDDFNIQKLTDLPPLPDISDLDSAEKNLNQQLDLLATQADEQAENTVEEVEIESEFSEKKLEACSVE